MLATYLKILRNKYGLELCRSVVNTDEPSDLMDFLYHRTIYWRERH